MAIRLGRMNIVNVLVEIGADINLRDDRGQTALHAAVWREESGIFQYLIARGADINIPNNRLETPLDWIYSRQWEIPAEHLERHERNSIPDVPLLMDLFATELF
ncbi:Putative ankyrin repeat protein [Zootermopsis nevadensis]|uniref:Putative ankyrin repeat protein n=2 Tax=Zootermopsis nevadensis TaxID=136037 RepID=A0A067R8P6_ZOONE|nr:Putative ankyrin repeat protein [Zootermopsis nevadensis]